MKVALTHNLKRSAAEAEAEFDTPETINALCGAIESAGHISVPIEVSGPIHDWLPRLRNAQPDVVLNTAEGVRGTARTALLPAVFDLLNLRYTGSDARTQMLTQDKHLTKLRVAAEGVPVLPGAFLVASSREQNLPHCPVIIKPNFEGSSKGITDSSVVTETGQMAARAAEAIRAYPDGLLVERYIGGTDVAVGFMEGLQSEILMPCSYIIATEWSNPHRLYDFRLKNIAPDEAVQVACPARIPEATIEKVRESAKRAVQALGLRGIARLDFRVCDAGEHYFIEANATPSLEPGSSLFVALQSRGISFSDALRHLIEYAAGSRHDNSGS